MFKRSFLKKNRSTEIDLRENFNQLLFGPGIKHSHLIFVRHARIDEQGNKVRCNCVDTLTKEAAPEKHCNYCLGEGFLWDEKAYKVFSTLVGVEGGKANRTRRISPGEMKTEYKLFYFKYDTNLSYKDKLVEIRLDEEGAPYIPYTRETIYKIETIQEYRSDNGRIEYIAVYCREEKSIRADR